MVCPLLFWGSRQRERALAGRRIPPTDEADHMPQPSIEQARSGTPRAPEGVISRSATAALWRVLNALREGWFLERRVRHVARMIAEEAHRQGMDADGMVVAMRREWPTVLAHRQVPDEGKLHMLTQHLVRFCLEELRAKRAAGARAATR
jgi:hypothetical protein